MTLTEKKSELKDLQKEQRDYNNLQNEGCEGFNPYDDQIDLIVREIVKLEAAENFKEWTKEVTIERRNSWNKIVKSTDKSKLNINTIELTAGFKMHDLKSAIEYWGVK